MSNREFEEQISIILRRFDRLRAAQRGDATVKRVRVRRHRVRAHWVGQHDRTIIVARKRHIATVKRAA